MTSLPLIYSARGLQRQPHKQGGIFALDPVNKHISTSQYDLASQKENRRSIICSLPKVRRKNKSIFKNTINSSLDSVHPDQFLHYENKGEVESVEIKVQKMKNSTQIFSTFLATDSDLLSKVRVSLNQIEYRTREDLGELQNSIQQKCLKLNRSLSMMRRETLMQIKVNQNQVEFLGNQLEMIKEQTKKMVLGQREFTSQLTDNQGSSQ